MKARPSAIAAFCGAWFFASAALTAPPPDTSELAGPPIERDLLLKDPEARCKRIRDQLKEGQQEGPTTPNIVRDEKGGLHFVDDNDHTNSPQNILAHIDDYRKMFWETYPDKPYHEEARDAFAQALFLKDIHYLQSDLVAKNFLQNTPFKDANLHSDTPEARTNQAIGQAFSGAAMDGSINPDGGIEKTALLQYEAWVDSTRKNLGLIKNLETNAQIASLLKTSFGILGADYRKACDFGGKEYQAYLVERDWAEFAAANRVPAAFDNKQHYGMFLIHRFGELPINDAIRTYNDMALAMGRDLVENAADDVRKAPKTSTGTLLTHVAEPYKLSPNGTKIPDYDMPIPAGDVVDIYGDPLLAFEVLITKDDDYRYLVYILQDKYLLNRIPLKDQTSWAFSSNAAEALYKAFGKEEVLNAAHLVRTATKRMIHGTIMDARAIGASRNYPFEAFEDILARKNPKGYILAALMFDSNPESPQSVDADAAYKSFLAASGVEEKTLLEDAARWVLDKPNLASRNEMAFIRKHAGVPVAPDKPAAAMIDNPDYLAWKDFAAGAKVSYVERAWVQDPPGTDHMVARRPNARHAYTLRSVAPDIANLWLTEIEIDYRSGVSSKPHDMEVGYAAKMPGANSIPVLSPRAQRVAQSKEAPTDAAAPQARVRAASTVSGAVALTSRQYPPPASAPVESGEETLDLGGRRISTRWQSISYPMPRTTNGTVTVKVWSSDEVPGHLVRKTEDRVTPAGPIHAAQRVILETYLESIEGFAPGTASPGSATTVDANFVPPPSILATAAPSRAVAPVPAVVPAPAVPARTTSAQGQPQPSPMVRLTTLAARAKRAETTFDRTLRRAPDTQVPADVQAARDSLDAKIKAATAAVQANDDQPDGALAPLEEATSTVEKFLRR